MKATRAPLFVVSIALVAGCGRTAPQDLLLDPNADAGEGGTARGGSAGNGVSGATGGISGSGGASSTGGKGGGGKGGGGIGGAPAGSGGGGQGGAAGVGGKAPVCGDGIIEPGEACEPGTEPAAPALELRQGAWRVPIRPLVGPTTAVSHYAYFSRSSHTGFEAPEKSSLYLYRWAPESALTLVLLNGIDQDTSGLIQPLSEIVFEISGLPDTAVVVISDDDVEFARTTPTTARADWDCDRNSDGGLVAGLPFPGAWHLTIAASFRAGISTWSFLSGGLGSDLGVAAEIQLDLTQPIEIVVSEGTTGCRSDCTVPRCGDGILDPAEVCDDGNEAPGDGCYGCRPD